PTSRPTDAIDTRNDAIIAPHAVPPETPLLRRRPTLAFTRNPTNGTSAISSSMTKRRRSKAEHADKNCLAERCERCVHTFSVASPFERRPGVGVQRLAMPEERDHDGQTHRRFRRSDRHHEKDDDL